MPESAAQQWAVWSLARLSCLALLPAVMAKAVAPGQHDGPPRSLQEDLNSQAQSFSSDPQLVCRGSQRCAYRRTHMSKLACNVHSALWEIITC